MSRASAKHAAPTSCPCGSDLDMTCCCARYHLAWREGRIDAMAPDAEALMRSRYCAYVLDDLDYLQATWHPTRRPAVMTLNEPGLAWLGLTIKTHHLVDAEHAQVEFIARYKIQGRAFRLHERSNFSRENGRWFYVDGEHL